MKGIIRKTILGIWFFGGLSACTSKPHFTIEGSLDEKVDGEAYIVGYPGWNKKPDTLAREIYVDRFTTRYHGSGTLYHRRENLCDTFA